MDSKTYEKILRKLLELSESPNERIEVHSYNLEDTFGFSPNNIRASLSDLEELKLIKLSNHDIFEWDDIRIVVLPKAFGYFQAKKEQRTSAAWKWIWETLKWLIPLIIGFLLGRQS